ncbi:peptide-methionine (S)-S-oxide reductase [Peptoniphilus ivorii]|uniref:peptide-methionine (S)-S-oxide reductase MsrA n=1 Tax=Aedoeadaptatus ivorii TaxID=54006 RepID=UPI00278971DF|nr:peptide-methionine (S)-S-oxide reductase MsrA [Peptoniphilus ivorii]MDQ0507715.1 peptide-methionine (S)-S-oxide reductase [Peptoniphilus ivorii]
MKRIVLAGGCFWGVEEYFQRTPGVIDTEVGYVNSNIPDPSYEEVCAGKSKAAEGVRIDYDESVLSTEALLDHFYEIIDPFSYHRQGMDIGRQYRTGIYYPKGDDELASLYKADRDRRQAAWERTIRVEIEPLENFYKAEEYHQWYLQKNPGGYCHVPLPENRQK